MNIYKVSICVFIITLCSCSQVSPTRVVQSPTFISTATHFSNKVTQSTLTQIPSGTQLPKHTPTATLLHQTTTTFATENITLQNGSVNYNCLDVVPSLPNNADIKGVIITREYGPEGKADTNIINLENGTQQTLPLENGYIPLYYSISPDKKRLAYKNNNNLPGNSRLIIADSEGETIQDLPWQDDWYLISGWLDNGHLLISKLNSASSFGSTIVLDPFTNEQYEVTTEYPHMILPGEVFLNWGSASYNGVVYNQGLTKVAYPRNTSDYREIGLWDITKDQEIAVVPTVLALSPKPEWAPDGSKVAIVQYTLSGPEKSNILLIDAEGEIEKITNLQDYEQNNIGFLNWSPDGRYIAFWMNARPSDYPGDRLVIIDTTTRVMTNYCVPGSINGDSSPPIWSPDSKQIIVENYQGDNARRVILIDILNDYAAQIAEDATPIGWMVEP